MITAHLCSMQCSEGVALSLQVPDARLGKRDEAGNKRGVSEGSRGCLSGAVRPFLKKLSCLLADHNSQAASLCWSWGGDESATAGKESGSSRAVASAIRGRCVTCCSAVNAQCIIIVSFVLRYLCVSIHRNILSRALALPHLPSAALWIHPITINTSIHKHRSCAGGFQTPQNGSVFPFLSPAGHLQTWSVWAGCGRSPRCCEQRPPGSRCACPGDCCRAHAALACGVQLPRQAAAGDNLARAGKGGSMRYVPRHAASSGAGRAAAGACVPTSPHA